MSRRKDKIIYFLIMKYISVVDRNEKPLMPTFSWRASRLVKRGRAIWFWRAGIRCIKLLDRDGGDKQPIAVGIDPGSKREGFTIKSNHHTYLNIQSKAVDWVKDKIETRREMRRNRRYRKTPYRKCRSNRLINSKRIPPSTRARFSAKLRILTILHKIFPIEYVAIEDIKAKTLKNGKRWNLSFSPLQVGKDWFYKQIDKMGLACYKIPGWQTAEHRKDLELHKSSKKLSNNFNAHCVDSWCLANMFVGGHIKPDNIEMLLLNPLKQNRRQLHDQVPRQNGYRQPRVVDLIYQKGALVKFKNELFLCGGIGSTPNSISLNNMENKRVRRSVTTKKLNLVYNYNKWGYGYA